MSGYHFSSVPAPYTEEACHSSVPTGFSAAVRRACQDKTAFPEVCGSKIIVLGDSAVGKTSLIRRYIEQTFECTYNATIGVEFQLQKFYFLGKQFDLHIWDTAGNDRFKTIVSAYYRGSNVVVLVFDASNADGSLENTRLWFEEAKEKGPAEGFLVFLVASKKDLIKPDEVEQVERSALAMAKRLGAELWFVSSKSGHNVAGLFSRVAALCFDKEMSAAARENSNATAGGGAGSGGGGGQGRQGGDRIGGDGGLIRLQKPHSPSPAAGSPPPRKSCCK